MLSKPLFLLLIVFVFWLLTACDQQPKIERTYTAEQVALGAKVFAKHCATCHGAKAQGLVEDWQTPLDDGSYPAPPLDGTGHAWHHDMPVLLEIVQQGGALYEGSMPAFAVLLQENEQRAAIAWLQSLWSDETYRLWSIGIKE